MRSSFHSTSRHQAFTLVELAIVLTIIGLLVGGVLVAQSLIEQAAIKGTVSQLEGFNAGAVTFRTRYHGLPGDLQTRRATSAGLTPRSGALGSGDGNALLQNGATPANQHGLGHETALFWRDLWDADLIQVPLDSATDAPAANVGKAVLSAWIPPSKIRNTAYMHVHAFQGRHYYYMGGFADIATDANGIPSLNDGLVVQDAYLIDEKLDDAQGSTGGVTASQVLLTHVIDIGTGANGDCLNANGTYNVDEDDAAVMACSLMLRTAF